MSSNYDVDSHRIRFAAWAAVTAARASIRCRFTRSQGLQIIEQSGLSKFVRWVDLPHSSDFDAAHKVCRTAVCHVASGVLNEDRFTHGVAAKLINVYLKSMFLTGADLDIYHRPIREKANSLHPPIDRLLLTVLAKKNIGGKASFWREQNLKGWSNFSSNDYERTIEEVRIVTDGVLWKIEEHWLGGHCGADLEV